ncbi:c-type cytochrome [Salinicoccus hispanicus]|uniref:C-type cytochrome n=2 Tax=Salinicoccus hispanicus TaxID=157225 RepID=A0A6N8U2W5_9STAP|nr:c-type cytochrome [Salinicoccus hispanicus]
MVLVLGACGGDSADEGTEPDSVDDAGEGASEQSGDDTATESSEESSEEASTEEGSDESSESGADAADSELAMEVYQNNSCVQCHGENMEGASGPDLTDVGNRLSEDEIRSVIEEGPGAMPAGLVTDQEELDAVAQWLASQTGE